MEKESLSTIYFIISCQHYIKLNENNVSIEINSREVYNIKKEVIIIKTEGQKYMNVEEINDFKDKSIYLYKIQFKIISDNTDIYIKLNIKDDKLRSKYPFKINKGNYHFFIYSIDFEGENFFNKKLFRNSDVNEFVANKFRINKTQKFLIYNEYIKVHESKNYRDYFLKSTANELYNIKDIIDYEFLLNFFIKLINFREKISELNQNEKSYFQLSICNFIRIKAFVIKQYQNKEYFKILETLEKYKNEIQDENIILNLDCFIILFYQINKRNNFQNFFKKVTNKNEVVNFMMNNPKYFNKYYSSELEMIYENGNITIPFLIELSSNFNEYIKFFCNHAQEILVNKDDVDLYNCPPIEENFEFNDLKKFVENTIDINNRLYFPNKQFEILIEKINKNNYKKLVELKSIFQKYQSNWKAESILKKLNQAIHETGKIFIESNKFNNEEIITFIQEDAKFFYKDYENEKRKDYVYLINHINLNKMTDNFYRIFNLNNYDYKKLFKKNYQIFVNSIIGKAESFMHIKCLFELFNMNKIKNVNNEILWEFINIFLNKILKKDLHLLEISKIIGILFKYIETNYGYFEFFINGLKLNFSEEVLNNIYTNILNDTIINLEKPIIDKLINSIIKNFDYLENISIINILKRFEFNKEIQKNILEKQKLNIISDEEIFNLNVSNRLKYILDLIDNGFFGEYFKNVRYINETKKFLNILIEKLNNFIFSMEQLKKMYQLNKSKDKNNNLKKRLFIITLGDNTIAKSLYQKLNITIDTYYNTYEQIQKVINIFSNYYPNDKYNIIVKYKKIIDFINENPINKFPKNIIGLNNDYKIADELYILKTSKIFITMFDILKNKLNKNNENDSLFVDETKKEFKNLEKLFEPENENILNLQLLEKVLKKIDFNEIDKEIHILSDIFNTNNKQTNDIIKRMILLKNREKNLSLFKKIILLLNDFEFENKELKEIFENSIEELTKFSSLNVLNEIDNELKTLNLNILNPDINKLALAVIDKMYEKPELINFLKDKTINDIRQMGEFIDDSEDVFINIMDISYLEACKKFIESLKNFSTEKIFLDNFFEIVKKDNNIGMKFANSSSKYHDFHELYTKHLNPNEMNKEHIKAIYTSSTFYLYPNYKCNAKYTINNSSINKDFEEILDLRDIALLRKKDQNEDLYFSVCEIFANIINDIQEILDILNIIYSKGYNEELKYTINVVDGYCVGFKNDNTNNMNDLKFIIQELNQIKYTQNQIVQDVYERNPVARLLYGKQFEFINYICKNNDYENNNNVYNLLKYITQNNNNKNVKLIEMINESNSLNGMYENVNIYLDKLFDVNSINLSKIYKSSFLKNKYRNNKGILIHSCSLGEIETSTINLSLYLTGNFPIAQTVLYCNSSTSEEKIISFLYRCILCDLNILFILIKPEVLDINKKRLLIQLLKILYQNNPYRMKACLLIIYAKENKTKEVIIEMEKLTNTKRILSGDYIADKYIFPDVEIFSSEFSGLGKSTLIKNKFISERNKNYEYIYFPIAGNINRREIIERLLELSKKKILLHLDMNDSYNIELIREFLFSFLILKYFSENENIFFYGDEIKIKIEIPNSFINFFEVFPILNFFNRIHITHENKPNLIISKDIHSNIQIVSNYMKYINQINQKDIIFGNINSSGSLNSIIAQPLSQRECQDLILKNINILNPNYYQINSFINLVGEQLILFTNSIYLNTTQLNEIKQIKKNLDNIRYFFVISLTLIIKHFITSSYDNIIKDQRITHFQQKGKIDMDKAKEFAIKNLLNKKSFSIKNIKPSMIFINEDGQSISEIITCEKNTDEYKLLLAIYNSDLIDERRGVLDYYKLSAKDFLIEAKKVLDLKNPIDDSDTPIIINDKRLKTIESITESYVFTADNFTKLILISLRLRTNIPVIMMGETGCGKTSLIKIIAELKNIKLKILNIHAGIEDKDIIEFLKDNKLFYNNNNNNEITWVFFDEINTCNSLGLLTEILLKNTCKGKKIKPNVKFIAACNPYRLNTQENEIIGLYDETKHKKRNLVYNVNPLPIPLLNFVFDFGTPEKEDIKRYILNIIKYTFKKYKLENIISEYIMKNIEIIALNSIYNAQEFIQKNYEISSVSLREIRRWGILFDWFFNLLKNPFFIEKIGELKTENFIHSLNLSIYLCYYIRIYDKDLRKQFSQIMKKSFGQDFIFEQFPLKIQNIIADSVDLEKGIAKNKTLLENIFAIFVCLNTKIPLFIIGKPGCSKSLSAQLIFKSMNGKDSSNTFFQYFPKVFTKSYQGSLTSDSKGILKIFKRARKSLEDERLRDQIISLIYFDEMGLAEISINNPLKVIHSELEYDDNKEKVAFIGISNWPLDASKMNRGIHLSITESDMDDLVYTALEIAKSYDLRLVQDYKDYFEKLATTYFEYKEKMKSAPYEFEIKINKNTKEFHGKRDFYHLIKIASKLLIKNNFPKGNYEIENILNESIERNFGGLENSIKIFKHLFKKYFPNINEINEYNVMECIRNNIIDASSRYLLIVTKSSISHFLVKLILDELEKKNVFYYGSNFEEDTIKGYYSAKVLNKVQITMSCDNVMILKNLTSMYPSLYDLFNQNFRKIGDNNYARIALGDSNTQNYFVHNNFRCIVLLDKSEIDEQDPPFINRFEKHIITFKYLLKENEVKMSMQIVKLFLNLIEHVNNEIKIDLKYQLLNCDLEEIQGIFYQITENIKKNEYKSNNDNKFNMNIYKEKIFNKIIPTFSQDLIFFSKYSIFAQKYREEFNNLINIYFENQYQHQNLKSFLEKIEDNKHVIYTFSNILDYIYEKDNINNKKYNNFSKTKTKNIFIESINSERDIDEQISEFYSNNNYNLCLLHYDIYDCIHLNHINYLIEAKESLLKDNNKININSKVILFIIHLKRKFCDDNKELKIQNEYLMSHLSKWNQFFIDNLNGIDIDLKKIFDSSNIELFNNKDLINLDAEFSKDLYHAFSCITYNIKINFSEINSNDYIEKICEYINDDEELKLSIQKIIKRKLENLKENIILQFFKKYNFEENDVDFISALIKYMKSVYNNIIIDTLIQFEKENILSTKLLCSNEMKNEYINKIYKDKIEKFNLVIENYATFSKTIRINVIFGTSYPFIISEFVELNIYTNTLIEDYFENEDKYRSEQFDDIKEYFLNKKNIEDNLKKEIEKKYFDEIFKNNNLNVPKLQQILFNDYIIYYLSKSNENFSNKNILLFFNEIYKIFLSRTENGEGEHEDNENIYCLENLSKFILFIESYKFYIYPLCKFICSMDLYIKDFIKNLISQISSKILKTHNKAIFYVNNIFFNMFESTSYCIINTKYKFEYYSNEDFNNFLSEIKIFSNIMMNANIELRLALKQILYIIDFIQVKEFLFNNGINLKKNLDKYLSILQEEDKLYLMPQYLKQDNLDKNRDIINEEFSFLKKIISKEMEYSELISKLLINKIKVSRDENYKINILKLLLSNNLFIIKNKVIFETLLSRYDICPIDKDGNKDEKEDAQNIEEDENDDDGTGEMFLSQLEENKDNLIIKFLNETDNQCLDEILLSLFDGKFSLYFENKQTQENLILNQSFNIFKKCVNYIINNNYKISNDKLGFLYCISYIKYYCFYLNKVMNDEEFQNLDKKEIFSFLGEKNNFKKIIKIYILKVLNLIIIKNYNTFLNIIDERQLFFNDFDFREKTPFSLNYLFLTNKNFNYYKELKNKYSLCKIEKFRTNEEIIELIKNMDNFICFYDLIINKEISNLINCFKPDIYNQISHFIVDIVNKINITQITKEIISLYYNINKFKEKILPSIKNLSTSDYEILLYSHKFVVISSMSKYNSIYSKIISPNIFNNIKALFLPGGEPNDSLKIKSGEEIQKYLNNGSQDGVYMCTCNYWYVIGECGKPMQTFNCKNCGQIIGGNNHRIVEREGHVRIIRDNEKINGNGTQKYLSQLMKEVEYEKNLHFKGFKKVKYNFFIDQNKNVRNMNNITYRILSFIFYSCVYYCQKIEYIQENELNNFYFIDGNNKNNNIFFILKQIWSILMKELLNKGINNIQCFLNMIIPELTDIIINNKKEMKNNKERLEFEDLCNKVVEKALLNYKNYYNDYININKEILEVDDISIKSILQETSDINNLPEKDFPLIKYFYVTNYPNYELFSENFGSIQNTMIQYPVLTNYLNALMNGSIDLLQNINNINPFINYVLDKYSNKITREEAKQIKIRDELINDGEMKRLFAKFKEGWKNIYKTLSNYDCHGKLPEKNITEDDCLAFCLNDNLEDNYGKYIATAYKDFITYQNTFLKNIIENNANKEYLFSYLNQIKKEIKVQQVTQNEVVSLDINNIIYKSFEDLIYSFAYRNCFLENGSINHINYKEIKFDFYAIEVELSKLLLSEKRLFSNEQNQEFITYAFEGFNKNECIIVDFQEKIKEIKLLTIEEKNILSNILQKADYKLFLFNLQSLFFYFTKKRNINGNELLIEEINLLPKNIIKIDEEMIDIFKNNNFNITLNKLIDCYEYIEFFNYDKILQNVSKSINTNLTDEQIKKLNEHFTLNNLIITINDLSNAVRKFISRFLVGDTFKNIEWNIFLLLKEKKELWNEKINSVENEEKFKKEIDDLDSINIKIKQSIDFYEKLGGERAQLKENNEANKLKKKNNKKKGKRFLDY